MADKQKTVFVPLTLEEMDLIRECFRDNGWDAGETFAELEDKFREAQEYLVDA